MKRECERGKERVAVVCRRACNASHSGTNLEAEVVDRSVHESEQCCGGESVRVCSSSYCY